MTLLELIGIITGGVVGVWCAGLWLALIAVFSGISERPINFVDESAIAPMGWQTLVLGIAALPLVAALYGAGHLLNQVQL